MLLAVGFWALTLGYALAYTGSSWFINPTASASLGDNLGISNLFGVGPAVLPGPTLAAGIQGAVNGGLTTAGPPSSAAASTSLASSTLSAAGVIQNGVNSLNPTPNSSRPLRSF